MTRMKKMDDKAGTLALVFLVVLITLVVYVAIYLPEWAVTIWAIVATLLLIPVAFVSHRFGRRDARLTTSGMHIGMDTVMTAADQATQFRGRAGYEGGMRRAKLERRATQADPLPPPATLLEPSNSTDDDILDL